MKTTLEVQDEVMRAAKRAAAERGITLTRFVEEALRRALAPAPGGAFTLAWDPVDGGRATVDPADREALYERMGEE